MSTACLKAWRRLPPGWRRAAHLSVRGVAQALIPLRIALRGGRRTTANDGPIFVVGLFGQPSGVGRSAQLFATAIEQGGRRVIRIDAGAALGLRAAGHPPASTEGPGLVVSHLNPPELIRWLSGPGARIVGGKRHVGYWLWELPQAPPEWARALRYVDALWTQSRFTAEALRTLAGAPAVEVVPHPVFALPRVAPDRARFGLPPGACAVLSSFDLRSAAARKNPQGALEAYLRAQPTPNPPRAVLVCKMRGAEAAPMAAGQLLTLARTRADIRLITDDLDDHGMAQLMASIDVLVSLHRAEGFGLGPAEALWLGKPVVATGWSGVMDFLDAESSALVGFTPTPVADPQGLYSGGAWAEPDVDDAARRLRALIEDPDARRALGACARARADRMFDRAAWLDRVDALLQGAGAATEGAKP